MRFFYIGQTVKTPTSWDPTGKQHLSGILQEKFNNRSKSDLYFPTQLSALKFLPWMLTAFIHLLPLAYFYICYMTKRTTTLPWPFERILWTDLTCWHWVIAGVVSTLILAPQFLVLAAAIRVHRFNPKLNSVQFPSNIFEFIMMLWLQVEQ